MVLLNIQQYPKNFLSPICETSIRTLFSSHVLITSNPNLFNPYVFSFDLLYFSSNPELAPIE